MEKHKLEKLASLKDEVREFQPLLYTLFGKLPSVTHVEHRQGPHEMGADFVITKTDATLGTTDYVGVIVKTGTIKQDHQDVDRQIGECEIDRLVDGGRRNITLNEIWIVSNENITANAQQTINHKYRHKNIRFLSGEPVCELIDRYFPEYWTDASVAVGNYLREIAVRSQSMTYGTGMLPPTKATTLSYNFARAESRTREFRPQKPKKLTTTLRQLSEQNQFVYLDAMMGMGKSTALGQLATELADRDAFAEHRIIPVLFPVKEVIEGNTIDLSRMLAKVRGELGELPEGTRFLVMLDALDEVELAMADRIALVKQVCDSARVEDCSLILTSRENDDPVFVREVEKRYAHFNMLQLSITQVVNLVTQVCKAAGASERLKKELDKSSLFRSLPKTPISAILLAKILDQDVQEIPSTMTELYSKYMELVLGRWDMSKGLQSQMEYDVILSVSCEMAHFLLENSMEKMSIQEARDICRKYVGSRRMLGVEADTVFDRILSKRELYYISSTDGTISFSHRTFAEFFYADRLHRLGSSEFEGRAYDPYWITTQFFRFGLKRDAPDLLKKLDEAPLTKEMEKLTKLFYHSGYLLAAYLTEYEDIKASMAVAFRQAADLYAEAHEDMSSQLRAFSEIQLLCIFTKGLCSSYGYEYFRPALIDIAIDIYSSPDAEHRLLELFFVNSALADTMHGESFDTMIENYGPQIPLALQFGIVSQSEDTSIHSDMLDRFVKNYYRKTKSNPGLIRSLKTLFDKPLSDDATTKRVGHATA